MKTMKFFMVALMCMMVSNVCLAGDRVISPRQLPKAAKQYIKQHYQGQAIVYAEVDYDFGHVKYEVKLGNGVELKFNARGSCYRVDYDDDYYSFWNMRPVRHSKVKIHRDYDDDDDDFDGFDD